MKTRIHTIDLYGCWHYVIKGTPVVIPGYEEYLFVFHKLMHNKGYGITELTTGILLFPYWEYCKNKATAITKAQSYLNRYNKHKMFKQRLQEYLDINNGGKPINVPEEKRARKTRRGGPSVVPGQMKLFPELFIDNEENTNE